MLLDAHPDLACPPEINLSQLCSQIFQTWGMLGDESFKGEERYKKARRQCRLVARQLAEWYLGESGKKRLCEKSLSSALQHSVLRAVFPRAQYVCLYRHAFDVVYSGLEASRWGFNAFGFGPYVQQQPGNLVSALTQYWMDTVQGIQALEAAAPTRCFRLYYELLVGEPEATLAELCSFLGVDFDSRLLGALSDAKPTGGPGDYKVWFSQEIEPSSIGRGSSIPAGMLPSRQREVLNSQLESLGYPQVDEAWNLRTSELRRGFVAASQSPCSYCSSVEDWLVEPLTTALRALKKTDVSPPPSGILRFHLEDVGRDCCDRWVAQLPAGPAVRGGAGPPHLITSLATLKSVSDESGSLAVAMHNGQIRLMPGADGEDSLVPVPWLTALLTELVRALRLREAVSQ